MRNGKVVVFLLEDGEYEGERVQECLAPLPIEFLWAKTLYEGGMLFDANRDVIDLVALDNVIWEEGFDCPRNGISLAIQIFQTNHWDGPGIATSSVADKRAEMMEYGCQYECTDKDALGDMMIQLLRTAGKLPA